MLQRHRDSPSNQEKERSIQRTEKWLRFNYSSTPIIGWASTIGATIALSQTPFWDLQFLFAIVLSFLSLITSLSSYYSLRKLQKRKALVLWDEMGPRLRRKIPARTRLFGIRISSIYYHDPHGAYFPLRQAIRLIEIYHRHQQRIDQLSKRLNELTLLQSQLKQKMARLHQLGNEHESGERSLLQFEADIATIRAIRNKIEASCQRLEILSISMQKSSEIRQLSQEINSLTTHTSPPVLPNNDHDESLTDIEQQISREVETFLQLERETDRHLQ